LGLRYSTNKTESEELLVTSWTALVRVLMKYSKYELSPFRLEKSDRDNPLQTACVYVIVVPEKLG